MNVKINSILVATRTFLINFLYYGLNLCWIYATVSLVWNLLAPECWCWLSFDKQISFATFIVGCSLAEILERWKNRGIK